MVSVFRQNEKDIFIQCTDKNGVNHLSYVNKEEVIQCLSRLHLFKSPILDNLVKNHKGITLQPLCITQFLKVFGNWSDAKGLKTSKTCLIL